MFVTSYSVTYCIYVPGKPGICCHYYCAVYDECKYSDTFWLADRTRLFVQYIISLSSLCKLIWRHWTYKMPVRYILSSVWVRLSILSPLSIIQYMGLYGFSLPISLDCDDWENIYTMYILCLIIIIKSEVWTMTHCLGLGHETMVSAVCLSIFFLSFGYGPQDWHLVYQYHQLQMHLIQTSGFHCTNYGIHVHEVSQWGTWSWNGRVSVPLSPIAMLGLSACVIDWPVHVIFSTNSWWVQMKKEGVSSLEMSWQQLEFDSMDCDMDLMLQRIQCCSWH